MVLSCTAQNKRVDQSITAWCIKWVFETFIFTFSEENKPTRGKVLDKMAGDSNLAAFSDRPLLRKTSDNRWSHSTKVVRGARDVYTQGIQARNFSLSNLCSSQNGCLLS